MPRPMTRRAHTTAFLRMVEIGRFQMHQHDAISVSFLVSFFSPPAAQLTLTLKGTLSKIVHHVICDMLYCYSVPQGRRTTWYN